MKFTKFLSLMAAGVLLTGMAAATPLVPPMKVKWSQAPDMDLGTDQLSMHRSGGPVVADDFVSNGKPITGFHWWGSYLNDPSTGQEWDAGQVANPNVDRLVSFEISFHQDCPAGDPTCNNSGPFPFSTPSNNPSYFDVILDVEESFFGTTNGGENVYEYWVSVVGIPGPGFLGGTWDEIADETYWVDFAWNAGQFGTPFNADVWGWHESSVQNLDFAVTTSPGVGGNPHIGPWSVLQSDMAFEVLYVPEPTFLALFGIGLAGAGFARKRVKT